MLYASHHQNNSDTNGLQLILEPSQCGKCNNLPLIEVYEIGYPPIWDPQMVVLCWDDLSFTLW